METSPPIPAGTVFMAWPYLRDPEVDQKIASAGQVRERRYDLAVLGSSEGCRFYRVLADHLDLSQPQQSDRSLILPASRMNILTKRGLGRPARDHAISRMN